MTQAFLTQTDFTAGELDPRLLGRTDLRSYQSGAAKLRNVVVETTGGVRRRPGMAYVATAEGPGRLVAFETGSDSAFLLAFSAFQVDIYLNGVLQATVATLWTEAQIAQIAWAQRGQSLLITHPDVPPQRLRRVSDTIWNLSQWHFVEIGSPAVTSQPFARFADPDVEMQATATSGTVTLTTSAPVFVAEASGRNRAPEWQAGRADQHPDADPGGRSGPPKPRQYQSDQELGRARVQRRPRLAGRGLVPPGSNGDWRLSRSAECDLAIEDQ
jgi:hypothetical protein